MHRHPNYLFLMLGLAASIALITASSSFGTMEILGIVLGAVTLLATAYVVTERKRVLFVALVLGALVLLPIARIRMHPGELPPGLVNGIYALDLVLWVLFTFMATVIVIRGIVTARRIGGNEVLGAVYGYLLIGVMFAQIYQLLLLAQPEALFFDPARFPEPRRIATGLYARGSGDLVYYSFITLGTVGYGDVTPASPLARLLSLVESVIGIMYVATMIARFVSMSSGGDPQGARREQGS